MILLKDNSFWVYYIVFYLVIPIFWVSILNRLKESFISFELNAFLNCDELRYHKCIALYLTLDYILEEEEDHWLWLFADCSVDTCGSLWRFSISRWPHTMDAHAHSILVFICRIHIVFPYLYIQSLKMERCNGRFCV